MATISKSSSAPDQLDCVSTIPTRGGERGEQVKVCLLTYCTTKMKENAIYNFMITHTDTGN